MTEDELRVPETERKGQEEEIQGDEKVYLNGSQFGVITDNNPLTYVLSSAKLDATSQRWIAALASYNFSIRYQPGSQNVYADFLSRMSVQSPEMVQAIL